MPLLIALILLAFTAGPVRAHVVQSGSLEWNWDPWIIGPLAVAALFYAAGFDRLRSRSTRLLGVREAAAYAAGLASLYVVLVTPIDAIADQLFWVHMVQHLVLILVAAPLLVMGRPAIACLWAFNSAGRKRLGRIWTGLGLRGGVETLMHPIVVWLLFSGLFVFWHFPGPYQWALRDDGVHTVEHLCFLVTALMFWTIVIEPSGRRRLGYAATLVFIITSTTLSALPGALIALAPRPLYPAHAAGDAAWGFTLLEDQQLAGMVMWIPGGFVYLAAACWIFVKWLEQPQRRRMAARVALPALLLCAAMPLLAACNDDDAKVAALGSPERGHALIQSQGCGSCHNVPGVADATGVVGPPLDNIGVRVYLAGMLRNTPDNMVEWLRNPQRVVPGNLMPDMHLSERDARDMAAYLYTLR
jgi:putative membrane protein